MSRPRDTTSVNTALRTLRTLLALIRATEELLRPLYRLGEHLAQPLPVARHVDKPRVTARRVAAAALPRGRHQRRIGVLRRQQRAQPLLQRREQQLELLRTHRQRRCALFALLLALLLALTLALPLALVARLAHTRARALIAPRRAVGGGPRRGERLQQLDGDAAPLLPPDAEAAPLRGGRRRFGGRRRRRRRRRVQGGARSARLPRRLVVKVAVARRLPSHGAGTRASHTSG